MSEYAYTDKKVYTYYSRPSSWVRSTTSSAKVRSTYPRIGLLPVISNPGEADRSRLMGSGSLGLNMSPKSKNGELDLLKTSVFSSFGVGEEIRDGARDSRLLSSLWLLSTSLSMRVALFASFAVSSSSPRSMMLVLRPRSRLGVPASVFARLAAGRFVSSRGRNKDLSVLVLSHSAFS